MSVQSVFEKIQEITLAIDGIRSAPTKMPGRVNDTDLPLALCFPGEAQWREQASGLFRQDRTFRIRVYVKPISQGEGPDEGFHETLPLLQLVGDTFNRDYSLGNTVDHIQNIFDGGVRGDIDFAGISYHGFELSFTVTIKED